MDQEQLWNDHSKFIIAKAKEFHRKFPNVLELDEKISIAWIWADKARTGYQTDKGMFTTYMYKIIDRGLFKAINKEISTKKVKNSQRKVIAEVYKADMDNIIKDEMLLDEKTALLNRIKKDKGGFYSWIREVHDMSLEDLSKITGFSKRTIIGRINKFRENN